MAHQTTPHPNSQANSNAAGSDLEPDQLTQDVGRGEDAALYTNADGAQTAGSRSFHITDNEGSVPAPQQETAPVNPIALPHNDRQQGITNHPIAEEDEQQLKVGSQGQ